MRIKFEKFGNDFGFTIAEVIIVLGIIGIVALNTLPTLITNLNENALAQSKNLVLMKITEATNGMKVNDILSGYATTDAFVNEFQKYIKVIRRCTPSNLNECFSPNFTTDSTNEKINISSLSTGSDLGHATYSSPLVGLQLINGTNIVLAFDPDCKRIDPWNNSFSSTSCIAMLYDINGFKAPNKIGKDIATLNATISVCDGTKIGALCVSGGDITYQPINEGTVANNYWAGARDKCIADGKRMPTIAELTAIYNSNNPSLGMTGYYWSGTEISENAGWAQPFPFGSGMAAGSGKGSNMKARCVK